MSWQDFLKNASQEKESLGLNAFQKAQEMGASQADINAFLTKKNLGAAAPAIDAGFGSKAYEWEKFLKGANKNKDVVSLAALGKAQEMGAGKAALNKFLADKGYKVRPSAQEAGYGVQPVEQGTEVTEEILTEEPAKLLSDPLAGQPTVSSAGTKYMTDTDKFLTALGTQTQSNQLIEQIRRAGYENVANINRGSDMFRSIMGAFNF